MMEQNNNWAYEDQKQILELVRDGKLSVEAAA